MSFTKEKFINLCYENRLKKLIYGLEQYFIKQKDFSYVQLLFKWFNDEEGRKIEVTKDNLLLRNIQTQLKDELFSVNPHLKNNITDDHNSYRKIFPINIILNDIRSPYNVGSFFRIGDAFGIKKIFLCGITPTPENKKVLRTAMSSQIPFEYHHDIMDLISNFKKKQVPIFGIEKTNHSRDIGEFENNTREIALIFGNEEFGLTKDILDKCDSIYHINMYGKKNSLNVSVAGGIVVNFFSQKLSS